MINCRVCGVRYDPSSCVHLCPMESGSKESGSNEAGSYIKSSFAVKYDGDKLRTDLLPVLALEEVTKVFTYGANKYADRNWEKGFTYSRCYGAALRHVFAWWRGESMDCESGLSHLSHAICCLLFLLEFEVRRTGTDDRPYGIKNA